MTAREAIARCLADVEDYPETEHYALADDVLLALENAGFDVCRNNVTSNNRRSEACGTHFL